MNVSISKNIIFLFFVAFLSGCIPRQPYDSKEFSEGNKSVVVINSKTQYKRYLFFKERDAVAELLIHWKAIDSDKAFISRNKVPIFNSSESVYDAYQIAPGEYYIDKYIYSGSSGPDIFTMTYTPKKNQMKFDIKPGEVLYLGDILLNDNNEDGKLVINDSFEKALLFIKNNYPELETKIKKHLIITPAKIEFKDILDG